MTKLKLLCVGWLVCLQVEVVAQQTWVPFVPDEGKEPQLTLISSSNSQVVFEIMIPGMTTQSVSAGGTTFQRISINGASPAQEVGSPELPVLSKMVAIPSCDSLTISTTVLDSVVFTGYNVYPSPNIQVVDSADMLFSREVFTFDSAVYSTNSFSPEQLATVAKAGALRAQKLGSAPIVHFVTTP